MLTAVVRVSDKILRKYTPDPFIIAILLSLVVFIWAMLTTESSPVQVVGFWGDGFWNLLTFTLQMAMILVGGFVVASAPLVKRGLRYLATKARTPGQAIVLVTLVSAAAACLNWGFGLVVGAFFALETAKIHTKVSFRVLVASAYSGFLFWHGGLSGSIPLVVNTPGNFSEKWIGGTIPVSETLFSTFNLTTLLALFLVIPFLNWWMQKTHADDSPIAPPMDKTSAPSFSPTTLSEKLENSTLLTSIMVLIGFIYLIVSWSRGSFNLDLNTVNFIFLFTGWMLHKTTKSFLNAIEEAVGKLGPLIIQYPFYAGIMGVMVQSGIAEDLSQLFVSYSTSATLPWLSFLSAGLVNLFVPSGGGQWAVQAPVIIPAARELGAHLPLTIMSVAWGDAWTNMLQPFWALPLLAIAGIKVREILGFCFLVLLVSGAVISANLLLFGHLTSKAAGY